MADPNHHKQSKTPGCWLGGNFYHLGQKWSPALLPHGTMFCVKCECLPHEKKGILQHEGLLLCKNIKLDCPKPKCDNAVIVKGRCCKTCPGEENTFEENFSLGPQTKGVTVYGDQQERAGKSDFVALLVGKNVRRKPVTTKAVAVVRITVEDGQLRFAVRYTRLDRPKFLQITDANGHVLVESPIEKRRSGDKKLCGVWTKIPSVYLQYFREKRLFAVITSSRHPKGLVAGRIVPNDISHEETFGAVMDSPKASGIGGVASMTYDPNTQIVNYVITFDGVFEKRDFGGEYFVTIEKNTKIIYQSSGRVRPQEQRISGVWKITRRRETKQLARGRLLIRVTSLRGATIGGEIRPRLTCGVFQALLSGSTSLEKANTPAAGSVIFELRDKGFVDYRARVSGVTSRVTRIRIEGPANRRNRRRVVGQIQKTFKQDMDSFGGWTNGTFKKMKAEDILLLLTNQLFVNVATTNHKTSELRGRVVELPYRGHFNKETVFPSTLVPLTPASRGAAAHAWLSMDVGCRLRYHVLVSSLDDSMPFTVLLGSHGNHLEGSSILSSVDGQKAKTLFETRMTSGSVGDVPEDLFRDLDEGRAYLQVNAGEDGERVLVGNVSVPNTCWQYAGDSDNAGVLVDEQRGDEADEAMRFRCYYEGQYYDNGAGWLPVVNASCNTCSCVKGKVTCHPLICPVLTCPNPIKLAGECCETCPGEKSDETCSLNGDVRKHPVGRSWHPFLPLSGFTKCVICRCLPGPKAHCERLPCPKLDCPASHRIRLNPNDCCQVCDPAQAVPTPETKPLKDINMEGACTFVDRVFANGAKWNPRVAPFGYMKCVVCRCRDGEYNCRRHKCPKLTCRRKIRKAGSCCFECDPNQPTEEEDKENNRVCKFGERRYKNGEKWRPTAVPTGSVRCAICRCKDGSVKCRIRCSKKKCQKDPFNRDPCCRQCAERRRKRRKNGRRRSNGN